MPKVLKEVTAGRPLRRLRVPIVVTWEQCTPDCPGWTHAVTEAGQQVLRCDHCERFNEDAAANAAHALECGCSWEPVQGYRDEREEDGPVWVLSEVKYGSGVLLRGPEGVRHLASVEEFREHFRPVWRGKQDPEGRINLTQEEAVAAGASADLVLWRPLEPQPAYSPERAPGGPRPWWTWHGFGWRGDLMPTESIIDYCPLGAVGGRVWGAEEYQLAVVPALPGTRHTYHRAAGDMPPLDRWNHRWLPAEEMPRERARLLFTLAEARVERTGDGVWGWRMRLQRVEASA